MPFFQYEADDPKKGLVRGTIQAASADEARRSLTTHGLRVRLVTPPAASTATPATAAPGTTATAVAPTVAPTRAAATQTAPRPAPATSSAQQPAKVQDPILVVQKTKRGNDRDLFLIFSQLASYLKSGVNPQLAVREVANRQRNEDYRRALNEAAATNTEGLSLSAAFARYPRLFPASIIGTLKAGEASGYLPDALEMISRSAEARWRLKQKMFWAKLLVLGLLGVFPISMAVINGALASMKVQDEAGGSLPPVQTLSQEVLRVLPFWGAVLIGGAMVIALLSAFWRQDRLEELRHRFLLWVPLFGARNRSESMSRFAWAMSMASRAGMPPRDSYELGARSVPNAYIRTQLLRPLDTATESSKSSVLLRESGMVPREME
ncbi:MAG: type II secretion system F family protein, partial [Fimbriimonas sp.]